MGTHTKKGERTINCNKFSNHLKLSFSIVIIYWVTHIPVLSTRI